MSGVEFEEALSRAEALLSQSDNDRRLIGRHRVVFGIAWASLLLVLSLAAVAVRLDAMGVAGAAATAVALTFYITVLVRTKVLKPLKANVYRDEQCAIETVGLLRELLQLVSRKEGWSA